MMPSTTLRLSRNGCPCRPELEGSRGSIRSHCSSVNWRNLDFVRAIRTPSRESPLSNGRHALANGPGGVILLGVEDNGTITGTIDSNGRRHRANAVLAIEVAQASGLLAAMPISL